MEKFLYSVRDSKTSFESPFPDCSDASAVRGFQYAFSNHTGLVNFSPADFSLYRVGSFDTDSGVIDPELPVYICSAADFVKNVGDDSAK